MFCLNFSFCFYNSSENQVLRSWFFWIWPFRDKGLQIRRTDNVDAKCKRKSSGFGGIEGEIPACKTITAHRELPMRNYRNCLADFLRHSRNSFFYEQLEANALRFHDREGHHTIKDTESVMLFWYISDLCFSFVLIAAFPVIPAYWSKAFQQVFALITAPFPLAACKAAQSIRAAPADLRQRISFYPFHRLSRSIPQF